MYDNNEERLVGTLLTLRWNSEKLLLEIPLLKFALFGSCMLPVSYVSDD